MQPNRELAAMIYAAELAAVRLRADFARAGSISVREKGPADFVSSADLASQDILQRSLTEAFPGHELVLEEGAPNATTSGQPRLLVDPLDGTTNFVHAIAHFSVAIALERDGAVVAGVVLNPASGELFYAERGRGAWLGRIGGAEPRRLSVSSERVLANAVIGTGIPNRGGVDHERYLAALAGVMRQAAGIRRFGSAALDLAHVAAGRFEAFFERGLHPWDVAGGSLLVTEAGGIVSRSDGAHATLDGGDILAACNPSMHASMVAELAPLHGRSRAALSP